MDGAFSVAPPSCLCGSGGDGAATAIQPPAFARRTRPARIPTTPDPQEPTLRYAIYLTPPKGSALTAAAEAWLGRSAFSGRTGTPRAPEAAAVATPARYGFHATLRAPFRLSEGADEAALLALFNATYDAPSSLAIPLTVSHLGRFVALTAADGQTALSEAEGHALHAFEPLRAPLSPEERARRKPDTLDDTGRALLDRWGYPSVRERFLFHMTLSGPISEEPTAVVAAARTHFAALLGRPQPLVHALFREEAAGGPFTVIAAQGCAGNATPLTLMAAQ